MLFPWARNIAVSSNRNQNATQLLVGIYSSSRDLLRKAIRIFIALPVFQKLLAVLATIFINVSLILVLLYNERIFGYLAPYATKWRDMQGGWVLLWILTFLTAFPPILGYSTTITMSGFVYGFPNGWFIVATATVFGSLASFIASRTILSEYVQQLVSKDNRFKALASTLKHDGLKILCMIRLCPLPYSITNAALSTFPTVQPLSFAVATAIASPKLLIHVFIGSRMAIIADARHHHHLETSNKIVNYFSIVIGILLGTMVGWIVYQRTMSRANELDITELREDAFDTPSNISSSDQVYSDIEEPGIVSLGNERQGMEGYYDGENHTYQDHELIHENPISFRQGDVDHD